MPGEYIKPSEPTARVDTEVEEFLKNERSGSAAIRAFGDIAAQQIHDFYRMQGSEADKQLHTVQYAVVTEKIRDRELGEGSADLYIAAQGDAKNFIEKYKAALKEKSPGLDNVFAYLKAAENLKRRVLTINSNFARQGRNNKGIMH